MADWGKIGSRGNVQDRRGQTAVAGGLGITGLLLLMGVNYLMGGNPLDILRQVDPSTLQQENIDTSEFEGDDPYEEFASAVLGANNEFWQNKLQESNIPYSEPTLVLFRNATESGCGYASSDYGPHYCPVDETIYLDETFFDELTERFGAKGGDVAEAYVISHEVAHHLQNVLGTMEIANQQRMQGGDIAQESSINLELQADCFAGMWASSLKGTGILEPGEIQEAMDAAAAVGDDRIQESANNEVNPETWTHGSSEERVSWFTKGYESESLDACNTFELR